MKKNYLFTIKKIILAPITNPKLLAIIKIENHQF